MTFEISQYDSDRELASRTEVPSQGALASHLEDLVDDVVDVAALAAQFGGSAPRRGGGRVEFGPVA
jgi:hypothetical protein